MPSIQEKDDLKIYPRWRKMKCRKCEKIFWCRNPNCFHEVKECYCDKCTKTFSHSNYGCEFIFGSFLKKLNPSRRDMK